MAQKYSDDEYRHYGGVYPPFDAERTYRSKLIAVKFDQRCIACRQQIARGQKMLMETAHVGQNWQSVFTCLNCLNKFIDSPGKEVDHTVRH